MKPIKSIPKFKFFLKTKNIDNKIKIIENTNEKFLIEEKLKLKF